MKKFLAVTFLGATLFLRAGMAEAHVIEIDGPIHGVMHIAPAHKPTATEPAHVEFFMMHDKGTFDAKAYAFMLQVTGEVMATTTVPVRADGSTLRADFTFPKEGKDYAVLLTGSSTVSGQPNFTLDFDDITVLPPGEHENPIENLLSDHIAHAILVALIIGAFGAVVAWDTFVVQRRTVHPPVS